MLILVRPSLPSECVLKGVPVIGVGIGTLDGGPRSVEIIKVFLVGGERGEKAIPPSSGGGPGLPLVGVEGPGSVLRARSVMLVPTVVPAGEVILVSLAISLGQGRGPCPWTGPGFFPASAGIIAVISVALVFSGAVMREVPRLQVTARFPVRVTVVLFGTLEPAVGVTVVMYGAKIMRGLAAVASTVRLSGGVSM